MAVGVAFPPWASVSSSVKGNKDAHFEGPRCGWNDNVAMSCPYTLAPFPLLWLPSRNGLQEGPSKVKREEGTWAIQLSVRLWLRP